MSTHNEGTFELKLSPWGVTKLVGVLLTTVGCLLGWLVSIQLFTRCDGFFCGGDMWWMIILHVIVVMSTLYHGFVLRNSVIIAYRTWRFHRWLKHAKDCRNCRPRYDAFVAFKSAQEQAEAQERGEASEPGVQVIPFPDLSAPSPEEREQAKREFESALRNALQGVLTDKAKDDEPKN